jgi:RNA polymerase sigma-70 factor (ECF subfamily)
MSTEQEVDDIQLLTTAQGGDADAFGEIYERYAPRVYRYLYAHLGNRLDAEDLTAEVFLRVWRKLPNFQEQGVPFLAFLFRVARNALIDHYRRVNKPNQEVSIEDIVLTDREPGPGEMVMTLLDHQQLRQTLMQMREEYRTVLVLRFLSELTPDETAQVMGRSSGSVRVLQHRALAALRNILDK